MDMWIANGARLGWLIDPFDEQVHVYRPATDPESLPRPLTLTDPASPRPQPRSHPHLALSEAGAYEQVRRRQLDTGTIGSMIPLPDHNSWVVSGNVEHYFLDVRGERYRRDMSANSEFPYDIPLYLKPLAAIRLEESRVVRADKLVDRTISTHLHCGTRPKDVAALAGRCAITSYNEYGRMRVVFRASPCACDNLVPTSQVDGPRRPVSVVALC